MKYTLIIAIILVFVVTLPSLACGPTQSIPTRYNLNTSVSPSNSGTIMPVGGTYDMDTNVTLVAEPESGYTFDHWGGDAAGTSNSIIITMDGEKNITAYFKAEVLSVIFQDTFIDNSNDWPENSEPEYSEYIRNGAYHMDIHCPSGQRITAAIYKWPEIATDHPNLAYEVVVTKITGQDDQEYGIDFLLRSIPWEGLKGGLRFAITGQGYYSVSRFNETSGRFEYFLMPTGSDHIKLGNTTNTMKVICRAQLIDLYINGSLVQTLRIQYPPEIEDNGVGFTAHASNLHVAFEQIKMWLVK